VTIPPHIRADLKHHLDVYVGKGHDALVFPALRDGCHLNDSVFAKRFGPACKTVGREGVNIHALRHFHGTMTAYVAPLAQNMARMGHSTVKAAMGYQHSLPDADMAVAEALSAMATRQTVTR
jgi:integrase